MERLVMILVILLSTVGLNAQVEQNLKLVERRIEEVNKEVIKTKSSLNQASSIASDMVVLAGLLSDSTLNNRKKRLITEELSKKSLEHSIATRDSVGKKRELIRLTELLTTLNKKRDKLMIQGLDAKHSSRVNYIEYKQLARATALDIMDKAEAITNGNDELTGIYINENRIYPAYFKVRRLDIKEQYPRMTVRVDPDKEEIVYLPMGRYELTVRCGTFETVSYLNVNPFYTQSMGKSETNVHFWAVKNRDY